MLLRKSRRLLKKRRQRAAMAAFEAIGFEPGDIAIDCGANRGTITARLANRGATVYAFEPHPGAFRALLERFADHPRVHCFNQAVSDRDETTRLYMHRKSPRDPLSYSEGASMLAERHNILLHDWVEVEAVDLAAFIHGLPRPVRLLKMDIEGYELRVLPALMHAGLLAQIEHVFVETHDIHKWSLWRRTRQLRRDLAARGLHHVNLDWQ